MNVFLTSSDAGFYLISQNSTSVSQEVTPPPKKTCWENKSAANLFSNFDRCQTPAPGNVEATWGQFVPRIVHSLSFLLSVLPI